MRLTGRNRRAARSTRAGLIGLGALNSLNLRLATRRNTGASWALE